MLNEVDFPLTNSQISEFILDEGYTTYFKLQQALSELLESLITVHFTILRKTEQRPSIILQTISLLQSSMISTNF